VNLNKAVAKLKARTTVPDHGVRQGRLCRAVRLRRCCPPSLAMLAGQREPLRMRLDVAGSRELGDGPADGGVRWTWPLASAERACCCPARPLVVVVMPPSPRPPYPVDLLLCGHHYRASLGALLAAGAAVYDQDGMVIPPG